MRCPADFSQPRLKSETFRGLQSLPSKEPKKSPIVVEAN